MASAAPRGNAGRLGGHPASHPVLGSRAAPNGR